MNVGNVRLHFPEQYSITNTYIKRLYTALKLNKYSKEGFIILTLRYCLLGFKPGPEFVHREFLAPNNANIGNRDLM